MLSLVIITHIIIHFLCDDVTIFPVTDDVCSEGNIVTSQKGHNETNNATCTPATLTPIFIDLREYNIFATDNAHMVQLVLQ